jgi:CRP/FNR family transcriptional regulator, anaerobic regulatory protein
MTGFYPIENRMQRKDIHNSELPLLCQSCEARHKGICGALAPDELIELSKHTIKTSFAAEAEIAPAGQKIERQSNIMSGVVKLSKLTADGRQQLVGLQFAPDFLGRPFARQSEVSAEAATEVRVCSFPASVLDSFIRRNPALEHRLHEQALRELEEARDWMLTLGRKTAAEKVASFLYLIATHGNPEAEKTTGHLHFDIPLKRSDIADFLGLTIETVSRQLTKLRFAGIVTIINNRTVEVADLERLKAATEVEQD